MEKCPVCRQLLPQGFKKEELAARLASIRKAATDAQRETLEADFRKNKLPVLLEAERKRVERSSALKMQGEIRALKLRAENSDREAERARRTSDQQAERRARQAAEAVARESEARIEKLNKAHDRERARHEADHARMRTQIDQMSRKLDKQNADQLGKEAEIDLLSELARAFPTDHIEPVRRGVKGADIIHHIVEDSKVVGRIVYESKNVSGWNHNFISQAKKYQTQYDTPNVVIVSRSFPRKKKGLCILKNIPVVEPHMAVCLASILRDGIREIGNTRIANAGRNHKAHQLYDYIVSDKFVTRFREMAESIESLRISQQKERDWHEDAWHDQTALYDKIDTRRREVDSQIRAIIRKPARAEVVSLAAQG